MINKYNNIEVFLLETKCLFFKDYLLKYETIFKAGGIVKFFIKPDNIEKIVRLIKYLRKNNLGFKIIGFTSNVIFLEEVTYSIIISTKLLKDIEIERDIIKVSAGYSLQEFVRVAILNKSKGFEGLEGIPASIAGAVFMNAGAYGNSISDNLVSVDCIDINNNIISLTNKECEFSYRNSIFKSGKYIILQATFQFNKGTLNSIEKKVEIFHIARHSYQDFVYPNLGSMISIVGDIYYYILRNNKVYLLRYWTLKFFYKNPLVKFIKRKKPDNVVFNKLLTKYLKKEKGIILQNRLSTKNSNILINDGTAKIESLIDYMFLMHDLMNSKFHIENEIITEPIYKINEGFEQEYQKIITKLSNYHNENSINHNS